ncbi:MAG: mannose-1-phosphate guanylyltransferase [Planctomycetes bacterium]|nr:mannose-1-phosphate guanylyltransferase [Planctomycetota bacterium]
MPDLYSVILAGGSGTRFWPLSRRKRPKQLLSLVGDESLVRATQRRLEPLVPPERRLVITSREHGDAVQAELADLVPEGNLLREPAGRDTAAAVALGALAVRARAADGLMAVLPADHVIAPASALLQALGAAAEVAAAREALVTLGIRPDRPATGYGYIKQGAPTTRIEGLQFFRVESFQEKPDLATARRYLAAGSYYWNSGMFVWSVTTILALLRRHLPATLDRLEPLFAGGQAEPDAQALAGVYPTLPRISVDRGILEVAPHVEVVEAPFRWDDVGAWTALENHLPRDEAGNVGRGLRIHRNTKATTVCTGDEHLVVTLGVENLVIVHTSDATLVARKDDVQDIKEIVAALARRGLDRLV